MPFSALLLQGLTSATWILGAMALVALLETLVPLHAGKLWQRRHVGPNLALTFITFATNAFFNAALVLALLGIEARGADLASSTGLPLWAVTLLVVAALDLTFYVAHVALHHVPRLWSVHQVHHSDEQLDVTTTIRQHPVEGVVRYVFMGTAALALGANPQAFAVYRMLSALNGLLEHANVRVPARFDSALALLFSTPNFHKVHHSRAAHETNTNYGNIFSLFDRMFGTFTPSERGLTTSFGLDGLDGAKLTTRALLALPFASAAADAPALSPRTRARS